VTRAVIALCAGLVAASARGDQSAFGDFHIDRPGVTHHITAADLPAPFATGSASNAPSTVPRPASAKPQALPGYSVSLYADALENPRLMRTAPNGDIFVAESRPGRIKVLRGRDAGGRAQSTEVFASGLARPFGIAFYPPGPNPTHLYVGNTDAVVRFPYQVGDLKARGGAETIAAVPTSTPPGRGHWSRDVVFSRDGRKMYVSVGSLTNVDDVRRPATCGCRSTSATRSATTWCRITSRTSSPAASTAGRGSTSARTRTRAMPASTRS
jgi:glucose/arabinose dehydrogenase